tara:strand:- start:481 stop:1008 length:528 start_codon:yes stop_codon:yes gene_type:complete
MQTREERAAKQKVYYEANKEKAAATYQANKEEIATKQKVYYEANKERITTVNKAWKERNKEAVAAYKKKYDEDNKEKRNAHSRAYSTAKRAEGNLMLFKYKGSECAHCKLSVPDHLEIYDYHHIDPATKLHSIANILHGSLERLMSESDKCLLLCANCHRKEHARLHKEKINEAL